ATHLLKKVWLNDYVIWSEDIAFGGDGWERVEIDLKNGKCIEEPAPKPLILTKINTNGSPNTLKFGFAFEESGSSTESAVRIADVQGVKVWVDDVYMKKFGDTEGKNIIGYGNFESGPQFGTEANPKVGEWYVSDEKHFPNS